MSAPVRALIVDDERLARSAIRAGLRAFPEIEIVAECSSGAEALAAIGRHSVDLMFLDVQMPELDGFQLLDALGSRALPAIVFVTAFDRYAVRAFEVCAVDYVLKPFDDERLGKAVTQALQAIGSKERDGLAEQMRALIDELTSRRKYPERLAVRTGERTVLLPVEQIDWIEAEGNYVRLHAGRNAHLARNTIRSLEALLDPQRFLRVSRSAIVNLQCVQECEPMFNGEQVLILHNGHKVKVSRGYRNRVQGSLGIQL